MSQQPAARGKAGPSADAAAAKPGLRNLSPLTQLRLARTVAALACLVAGVVGYFVLSATADNLSAINSGTQHQGCFLMFWETFGKLAKVMGT